MLTGMREEGTGSQSWRYLRRHARGGETRVATTEGFSKPYIIFVLHNITWRAQS